MSESEDQLYKNLADWFYELDGIVLHLHTQKDVFWRVMKIIGNNPKLSEQGNHFFEFMKGWYESHVIMAIRRLADHRNGTRSYLKFLERVKRDHRVISRARYKNEYVDDWFSESQADRGFDDLAGEGKDCLSTVDVEKDIQELRRKARAIMDYVVARTAHFNPSQPRVSESLCKRR